MLLAILLAKLLVLAVLVQRLRMQMECKLEQIMPQKLNCFLRKMHTMPVTLTLCLLFQQRVGLHITPQVVEKYHYFSRYIM